MAAHLLFSLILLLSPLSDTNTKLIIQGAWRCNDGVLILSSNYFAFTAYSESEFNYTYGGSFEIDGEKMVLSYEFHSKEEDKVGTTSDAGLKINGETMVFVGGEYIRIDEGSPGKLFGTWLFSNRVRNGEMGTPRNSENPRKTMKILSGTRFQWIAYNDETKQFSGTGGGTYTTIDGKYTENIDFFSRDNSRVGASLEFDFERKGNEWHHKGLSSKGDPIHEIWSLRK